MARMFHGGEAELEVAAPYASGDLAVLVAIERQHGPFGGLPDRTGRCGSRWCSAGTPPVGGWRTGTPTRWSTRSAASSSPCPSYRNLSP